MRPWLCVNMAMTLDGKVMRPEGGWHGLTSPADAARMERIRGGVDFLIVGRNSIAADDPEVYPEDPRARLRPVMIVRSQLPPFDRKIFARPDRPALLLAGDSIPEIAALPAVASAGAAEGEAEAGEGTGKPSAGAARGLRRLREEDLPADCSHDLRELARRAELYVGPEAALAPEAALEFVSELRPERDRPARVLLEGGPSLNHAFFARDLVDELNLTLVPFLIGERSMPAIVDGSPAFPGYADARWRRTIAEAAGDEVFLTYERERA